MVTGRTASTFDPNGTLTRQELATILYRYCTNGKDVSAVETELTFADAEDIASWAAEMCIRDRLMLESGKNVARRVKEIAVKKIRRPSVK